MKHSSIGDPVMGADVWTCHSPEPYVHLCAADVTEHGCLTMVAATPSGPHSTNKTDLTQKLTGVRSDQGPW
jgi:hypothetical protein